MVKVAEKGSWIPAQVALAWLRTRPGVVIPMVGATKEAQLRENLASVEDRHTASSVRVVTTVTTRTLDVRGQGAPSSHQTVLPCSCRSQPQAWARAATRCRPRPCSASRAVWVSS
ncbi:aldo/keto reductase, partial [Carbonactinospora thermoautotrophica]|uniref:aldo/keto reductase n=1 Tax=Carbonactinospora thermoautotrophica TaxID=1469144 RepID=UPI0039F6E69E